MRFALWLLALFALATAAALFASDNPGTVSIFFPPHRLDVSLNLALVGLVALVAVLHLTLTSLRGLIGMPQAARAWRKHQRERAAVQSLVNGASHFLAGRYTRAVRDAHTAAGHALAYQADPFDDGLEHHDSSFQHGTPHPVLPLAHWLAAEAHHALQNKGARNEALRVAQQTALQAAKADSLNEGLSLRAARFALDDRDPQHALGILAGLSAGVRRRTAALRMQLRAARLSGASTQALDVARTLAKHRAFSESVAWSLRSALAADVMRQSADAASLQRAFKALDAQEQAMPDVVMAAAACLQTLSADSSPHQSAQQRLQARSWLLPLMQRWNDLQPNQRSRLAPLICWALHDSADEHSGTRELDAVAALESLQQAHPSDGLLHHLCGSVLEQRQLWGKAQAAYERASPLLKGDEATLRANWIALARLADRRGDAHGARMALSRAAAG